MSIYFWLNHSIYMTDFYKNNQKFSSRKDVYDCFCSYIRWQMSIKLTVVISARYIMLYTLNLYSAVCQLCLNKTLIIRHSIPTSWGCFEDYIW